MKKKVQVNRSFQGLKSIGTRNETLTHSLELAKNGSFTVGVNIGTPGDKKKIVMELLVPSQRSFDGSRTTTSIKLNGSQTRELYEQLAMFYLG